MAKLFFLNESDQALLKGLIARFRDDPLFSQHTVPETPQSLPPEVYVAKPQEATGIPALEPAAMDTGTGTGTGPSGYASPGSAWCDIYQIVDDPLVGYPELVQVGIDHLVYNVSSVDISQDYVVVKRDKFGQWLVEQGTGFGLVEFCCGAFAIGTSTSATVTASNVAGTVAGDVIMVSDPCNEYYNTSGSGCGMAYKMGINWHILRLTCPDFVAVCGDTGTGT